MELILNSYHGYLPSHLIEGHLSCLQGCQGGLHHRCCRQTISRRGCLFSAEREWVLITFVPTVDLDLDFDLGLDLDLDLDLDLYLNQLWDLGP